LILRVVEAACSFCSKRKRSSSLFVSDRGAPKAELCESWNNIVSAGLYVNLPGRALHEHF
jgi:hypothetical protein